ncbi:MAG: N-acetylglucosamine-6-phosphate deacetylase [Verrucomicrobia bacterium]|nr:N-acetylglucosamine-6-phosphate deacetylase [Verrucomicrobiota bacterium]
MNPPEIVARHFSSRQNLRLKWWDGVLTRVDVLHERTPPEYWIAPGLLDLQVNGFAGVDFQADTLTLEDLLRATHALRLAGCSRYFLTLMTDDWSRLTSRLRHLRALRAQAPDLQTAIAGWHLEGPFLSAEPGFHGAHDPAHMLDPTPDRIQELRALTGPDPWLLVIAPERTGALEAIALAVSLGAKVSLGHTNASAAVLRAAVDAGATGFTHLGNACPQQLDRHDNILWRVFETAGLTVSLIPDQTHVSPTLFRLAHRLLPLESLIYISDAMAAAGAPPGRYTLGKLTLEVGPDRVVRYPGRSNFAGSALRPIDGVFHAAAMLGIPWQTAWHRFSVAPAEWLGLPFALVPGQRADFCLLRVSPSGELSELRPFAAGRELVESG